MNRPKQGGAYVMQDDGELETAETPTRPPLLPHEIEAARARALAASAEEPAAAAPAASAEAAPPRRRRFQGEE